MQENNSVKIVGILALCAAFIVSALAANTDIFSKSTDTIQVTGQGKVPVRPDGALVNLGVIDLKENTPEDAIRTTAEKIDTISKALTDAGIPTENQTITGYVLHPVFGSKMTGMETTPSTDVDSTIKGYTASQQITVRITDIGNDRARINDIIAAATKAGANQVGEIQFIASNVEKLKEEARLKALADAQEKAKEMARVSGISIGKITGWYNENALATPGQNYPNQNSYSDTSTPGDTNSAPAGYTILKPGQLDIVIEINVNYQLK